MIALYAILYAYQLWIMFLAVMALKAKWNVLPVGVRILAAPAVLAALVMDVAFNLFATLPFADLPAQWTFSQRMGDYKKLVGDWRQPVAAYVCSRLLDPFEAGGHCR